MHHSQSEQIFFYPCGLETPGLETPGHETPGLVDWPWDSWPWDSWPFATPGHGTPGLATPGLAMGLLAKTGWNVTWDKKIQILKIWYMPPKFQLGCTGFLQLVSKKISPVTIQ